MCNNITETTGFYGTSFFLRLSGIGVLVSVIEY